MLCNGNAVPDAGAALKRLLARDRLAFAMEAHNPLAARIVGNAGFDVVWASGFSISTALGKRDRHEVSSTQLIDVLQGMREVTDTPILVDADTGFGDFNNFRLLVRRLSAMGVGGACIEDKTFPKLNSFVNGRQVLIDAEEFCGKIRAAKDSQLANEFCIVARTEALVVGAGMHEALERAERYRLAGADAILIHSKEKTADQVLEFALHWAGRTPLIAVPTTYSETPCELFEASGFGLVIWANHMIRASVAAMSEVCNQVSSQRSVQGISNKIVAMEEVFDLFDYAEVTAAERRYCPDRAAGA